MNEFDHGEFIGGAVLTLAGVAHFVFFAILLFEGLGKWAKLVWSIV
jgi:hypothetical protein